MSVTQPFLHPHTLVSHCSESQAKLLLRGPNRRPDNSCGKILNNSGLMEFHQQKGELSIEFRNMVRFYSDILLSTEFRNVANFTLIFYSALSLEMWQDFTLVFYSALSSEAWEDFILMFYSALSSETWQDFTLIFYLTNWKKLKSSWHIKGRNRYMFMS